MAQCFAVLGWSLPAIESIRKLDKPYVVVSFPDFEEYASKHDIPFVGWDFNTWNESHNTLHLAELLRPFGADVAVPLFEETVEWAGALNSLYRDDPRVLNRAMLFRNKALMKRKALLAGLRVGLFEEARTKDDVRRFMDRLNEAELTLPGEADAWVHAKPFLEMGAVGHRLLRSKEDIEQKLSERDFPCLIESHLPGREFSCEGFVHDGKIRFLNITEYVELGYSNFIPPGPELRAKRPLILEANQKLVDGFGIRYGFIHPEWFLNEKDEVAFGEVAFRIPGGHMYELMSRAFEFDPYAALFLCHDPATSEEELARTLPPPDFQPRRVAGCLMVYPRPGHITKLEIPDELEDDPYFVEHTLFPPTPHKVESHREGFGNHYGTIFFEGEDPERMKELLVQYRNVDFLV